MTDEARSAAEIRAELGVVRCPTCRQDTIPLRTGRCGWCERPTHEGGSVKQTSIFGDETDLQTAPELTERQQFTLNLVRHAGHAGLSADEAGAAWCAHRGKHPDDTRCEWCGQNGRDILRALRKKGHVKSRRDGTWYALQGVIEPNRETPPGYNEFPAGF